MNELIQTAKSLPMENRAEKLFDFVEQVRQLKTCSNVVLARVLYEIDESKFYETWTYTEDGQTKNYSSIADFGRIMFEYSSSTTKTFIRIHEKFVVELGVDDEQLAGLSWGNLKIVVPHVNKDNLKMVLKLCEGKQKDVREWAATFAETPNEKPPKYSFTCSESQAEIFDTALEISREQITQVGGGPSTPAHEWEYIVSQFLMLEIQPLSLADYLILLESRFDVKLGLVDEAPLPPETVAKGASFDEELPKPEVRVESTLDKLQELGLALAEEPEEFPDHIEIGDLV